MMRFLVILFACILAWVLAAPSVIDREEDAFRLLNNYLQKYGPDENYIYLMDHGSAKRGLGPRPLRFGRK
ncbi:unnamed protein product [Caenorhabditis angaria]|uniref:Uncharacterized protein n=1 Tax=Caenorhabditis angaria TaxID=860376 RepID=A0A9P1J1E9_9PELO|nr:unnamed protein product [Caenorhabditis angaria]